MKISVRVKAGTSQEKVEEGADFWTVWVRAKAHDGEANAAVIKLLSKYLSVSKSSIKIVSGATSKNKIIEVL